MMKRKQMYETFQNSTLKILNTLPDSVLEKNYSPNQTQQMYNCIFNLHHHSKPEELVIFFKQIGVDQDTWISLDNHKDKSEYVLKALDKSIQQGLKKLTLKTQSCSISNGIQQNKIIKPKGKDFEWLNIKTKNEMLKEKLKTKLVQSINEFKNEQKLRKTIGIQLDQNEKIHLQEDDDDEQMQTQKIKMQYQWSQYDEQLFLKNIQKLKQKFISTQFLKNCNRFKFISNKQLATLASQQISRKLDKTNKAFLSRQFLLDKYFSTSQTLTQKQIKFILKTSPLLGKCVDKAFVKAAIKNICYSDIDKMQLQIAQQIIKKFQTIRNLVRQSRKTFKQNNNMIAKSKIKQFQIRKKKQQIQHSKQQAFKKHKVKILRKINFQSKKKQNNSKLQKNQIFVKRTWPIPLNNAHPPTGLFVKDCNQQCNEDLLNQYQKNYLEKVNYCTQRAKSTGQDMIKYYTGGPNEKSNILTDKNELKLICQAFKTAYYRKQIENKLMNYELQEQTIVQNEIKTNKSILGGNVDFGIKKTIKKFEQSEKIMRQKIIQNNQKTKMQLYVKKLLSAASQNNFHSFKALGLKFTPNQINRTDNKKNTPLFYAIKHKNLQFIDYILSFKGDVNVKCSKGMTPLHKAFQSNNYALIFKCLMGAYQPDLNVLDDEGKTPLGYCTRKILQMLNLENGVVCVQGGNHKFDNNKLLQKQRYDLVKQQQLQVKVSLKKY